MFKNYVKVAERSLIRHRAYAAINILSLAIGIACCLLIFLYVRHELTYDHFHEKHDRIHTVVYHFTSPSTGKNYVCSANIPAGPLLKEKLHEVEDFARTYDYLDAVAYDRVSRKELLTFADPSLLTMFTFPLLRGDANTALSRADGVVLSEATARKYFGTADTLGGVLSVKLGERFHAFTVTGVAREIPDNSSIRFDILLPIERLTEMVGPDAFHQWGELNCATYVLVKNQVSDSVLAEQVRSAVAPHILSDIYTYDVKPLNKLHLSPDFFLVAGVGNPTHSYILSAIAILVLLIACFNFMNLAIARSAGRSREIGIRMVVGANRGRLARQFWGEAMVLSIAALLVGVALAEMFLPVFNALAGKQLALAVFSEWSTWAAMIVICLITGFVAGSYPALVLSGLRPVDILRHRLKIGGKNIVTRVMIAVQFTFSIFLLVALLVMSSQLDYVKNTNLGFDDEHLLSIELNTPDADRIFERLRQELTGTSRVLSMSATDASFSGYHMGSCSPYYKDRQLSVTMYRVDSDFLSTVGMELIDGRGFSSDIPGDKTHAIIVNQAFASELGVDSPVGEVVSFCPDGRDAAIIGMVKDFHYLSLHRQIGPVALHMIDMFPNRYFYARIGGDDIAGAIGDIETAWRSVAPDLPFSHNFVDQAFDAMYAREERWSNIVRYSAGLAILIAAMGLFGLSALMLERRSREICIRKVHGATIRALSWLVCREYFLLVIIASVIAWVVGYFVMTRWLEGFAYRVEIDPLLFVLASLLALAAALVAVGYQILRAASVAPADTLRYE